MSEVVEAVVARDGLRDVVSAAHLHRPAVRVANPERRQTQHHTGVSFGTRANSSIQEQLGVKQSPFTRNVDTWFAVVISQKS